MKFLIDSALPPHLEILLLEVGHDAVHTRSYGMQASTDEDVLQRALQEDRILISADTDFGTILAKQEATHPSFVLFRDPNLFSAHDYLTSLLAALPVLEMELLSGCVAVFRNGRLRVRRLPISG